MADDPDAIWKPGTPSDAEEGDPSPDERPGSAEPMPASGSAETLADRFRPATGRRSEFRAPTAVAEPAPASPPPAEIVAPDGWVVERDESDPDDETRPRRWRRAVPAVLAVVAVVVVAVVVVRVLADDASPRRPGPDELTAADERRLPDAADELWSTTLNGTGNALASSIEVDGRALVVAIVDDGSRNRSRVVGVDAASGDVRWGRSFSFAPPEVSVLGVLDGVVVLEQTDPVNRRLIGLSATAGETVWERRVGGTSFSSVPLGTELIANWQPEIPDQTTFYDPATGEPVGDVLGDLVTTDLNGTWYITRGLDVLSIDLSEGWTEPVLLIDDGPPPGDIMAVVDGRILVANLLGQLSELTADSDRLIPIAGDELPAISFMLPSGGSSFVAANGGEMFGVELVDDRARLTWRRLASNRGFALTERGVVLRVTDEGIGFTDGVDLLVIDGVTGDKLADAGAVDGVEEVPLIVGNGFITATEVVEGNERTAHDLDGNELWRLVVDGRLRVGDELIVVLDNTDAGFRLTAYGAAG